MRVPLRDGQWAELREHITHGQDKEITRARAKVRDDREASGGEDVTTALRVFISAWNVNDPDGKPIILSDADAIDRMPSEFADFLIGKVLEVMAAATVPNPSTPSSSDGSSTATAE